MTAAFEHGQGKTPVINFPRFPSIPVRSFHVHISSRLFFDYSQHRSDINGECSICRAKSVHHVLNNLGDYQSTTIPGSVCLTQQQSGLYFSKPKAYKYFLVISHGPASQPDPLLQFPTAASP
jgi:hypothetical protein